MCLRYLVFFFLRRIKKSTFITVKKLALVILNKQDVGAVRIINLRMTSQANYSDCSCFPQSRRSGSSKSQVVTRMEKKKEART